LQVDDDQTMNNDIVGYMIERLTPVHGVLYCFRSGL